MSDDQLHPMSRPELWQQLDRAIALRSNQDQVLWSLFGTFWASNAILLVALLSTGNFPANSTAGLIVSTVGVALCLSWGLIQRRALAHLIRNEGLMARFERALRIDPDLAISWDVNTAAYDRHLKRGPRARQVMQACPATGLVVWLGFVTYFALAVTVVSPH